MQHTLPRITAMFGAMIIGFSSFVPAHAGEKDGKALETPPVQPPPSPWSFRIEPYGWLTSLDGTLGARGLTTDVDIPFFNEILDHLDMAAALQLEVRYNRWGLLLDGFYADLGGGGNPPGPFYSDANVDIQQGLVEVALAYRVVEGKYGFVDLFAGARYNNIDLDITASLDRAGIENLSDSASARIVRGLSRRAREIAEERLAEFQAAAEAERIVIEDQVQSAIQAEEDRRVERDLARELREIRRLFPSQLPPREIAQIERALTERREALAEAAAEERVASLRASVATAEASAQAEAQARLTQAQERVASEQKKLAGAIDKEILKRLPESASADEEWVDPFVGLRAQWNMTKQLFLAVRADIGGFGVSSDLVWQLQGTLGVNLSRSVFVEAGWRYLHTDYTNGGFTYDLAQSGAFLGLGFKF